MKEQASSEVAGRCSFVAGLCTVEVLSFFKRFYLFLMRGDEREKERERNINVWLPLACLPTGDLAHNPGMCPDWELNLLPFGLQASTQSTEPHQPGLEVLSLIRDG